MNVGRIVFDQAKRLPTGRREDRRTVDFIEAAPKALRRELLLMTTSSRTTPTAHLQRSRPGRGHIMGKGARALPTRRPCSTHQRQARSLASCLVEATEFIGQCRHPLLSTVVLKPSGMRGSPRLLGHCRREVRPRVFRDVPRRPSRNPDIVCRSSLRTAPAVAGAAKIKVRHVP